MKIVELEDRVKKLESHVFTDDKDIIFEDVVALIKDYDVVSASLLQRKLSIGYAKAARLLDQLEQHGYIGIGEGAKPRKVIKK